MHIPAKPFRILAAAPFRGIQGAGQDGPLSVTIDKYSMDRAFQALRPVFFKRISIPRIRDAEIQVEFGALRDFMPGELIKKCSFLSEVVRALEFLQSPDTLQMQPEELESALKGRWPYLPIDFKVHRPGAPGLVHASTSSIVDDILSKVSLPDTGPLQASSSGPSKSQALSPARQVLGILKELLEAIYTDRDFRQMEEAWRGLWFLVKQGRWADDFTVELLSADRTVLAQALETCLSGCNSHALPDLVLVDNPVDASPYCLELLEKLAGMAEENLVPLAISLEPGFFHVDSWEALDSLPFLGNYMEEPFYGKWQHLRRESSSRWLMALFNEFLLREPLDSPRGMPEIAFSRGRFLWGDAVWAFGALCGRSIEAFGWPTCFHRRGIIHLDDLPLKKDGRDRFLATRIYLNADRLEQMARCGISPVFSLYNDDSLFLPVDRSVFGHSMAYQLMVSRISRFTIQLSERIAEYAAEQGPLSLGAVEELATRAVSTFLDDRQVHGPFAIKLQASETEKGDYAIFLEIHPPRDLLSHPEPIFMEFAVRRGRSSGG